MKKILIVSDSHKDMEVFNKIIKRHQDAEIKIHCGDSCIRKDDPSLKDFLVVEGNHDIGEFPISISNPPFYIAHGHVERVYHSFDTLVQETKVNGCSIAFYGHTHIPYYQVIDDVTVLNPGSTMFNRGSYDFGTYVVCHLDVKKNRLDNVCFFHHTKHIDVTDFVLRDGEDLLEEIRGLRK